MKYLKFGFVALTLALGLSFTISPITQAKTYNQNGLTLGDTSTFKPGIEQEIGTLLNKQTDSLTKKQLIDYFKIKGYSNIGQVIKAADKQGYDVSMFSKFKDHKGWK